jgi:predicted nucleotidyltransferase component of viral defense system
LNNAAQLKAKVKSIAVISGVPAQAVLQNYMMERLLERISLSKYREKIIIKGGLLIGSFVGIQNRTTMDLDATIKGFPLTEEMLTQAFDEICAIPINDDVCFSILHTLPIREDDPYGGYRIAMQAVYASIVTPLKVDITTGDRITPQEIRYVYISNFDNKAITICAYNPETVLAEKVETVLRRSILNTRLRDFYDIYILTEMLGEKIDRKTFLSALIATSEHRGSGRIIENPRRILDNLLSDEIIHQRWQQYRQTYSFAQQVPFEEVLDAITDLLGD